MTLFLLLPLKFSFAILIVVCLGVGSVWVHLVWDPLCLLYLNICFCLQVWEVFSDNFLKYIFDPLLPLSSSGTPIMCWYA